MKSPQTSLMTGKEVMITDTKYRIVNIFDVSDNELQHCMEHMPEQRKARVLRLRSEESRRRTIAGELLARRLIAQQYGISPDCISFGRTERGKPFAIGLPVEFSVSHSGELVLCAVSDKPVGADIQRIRPVNDRLIARVCTEKELLFVTDKRLSEQEKTKRFFRIWTGKEAYFKFTGTGITDLHAVCIFDEEIYRPMTYFTCDDYAVSIFTCSEGIPISC